MHRRRRGVRRRTSAGRRRSSGRQASPLRRRPNGWACRPIVSGGSWSSPTSRCPGHPDIFAIGDTAHVEWKEGRLVPGIAPAAKQQGRHVAATIRARLAGDMAPRPFRYRHDGDLATIGKRAAAIDFGWIKLTGWIAWWMWGIAHIYFLIGLQEPADGVAELAVDLRDRAAQRAADHAGRRGRRYDRGLIVRRFAGKQSRRCHSLVLDFAKFPARNSALEIAARFAPQRRKPMSEISLSESPCIVTPLVSGRHRRCRRAGDAASVFGARPGQPGASQDHGNHRPARPCVPLRLLCRQAERHDGPGAHGVDHRRRSAPRRPMRSSSTMATSCRATRWATTSPMSAA